MLATLLVSHSSGQGARRGEQFVRDDLSFVIPGCERMRATGATALLHACQRNLCTLVLPSFLSTTVQPANACLNNIRASEIHTAGARTTLRLRQCDRAKSASC